MQNRMSQPSIAPGILPGIKPTDLKVVYCKNCNNTRFIPVVELRYASLLQTAIGQPMIVSFQGGYTCTSCGKMNEYSFEGQPEEAITNQENVIN